MKNPFKPGDLLEVIVDKVYVYERGGGGCLGSLYRHDLFLLIDVTSISDTTLFFKIITASTRDMTIINKICCFPISKSIDDLSKRFKDAKELSDVTK